LEGFLNKREQANKFIVEKIKIKGYEQYLEIRRILMMNGRVILD
jgi:hypothetical protein